MFDDFLERKQAFLGFKERKFTKTKIGIFFKGVSPSIWSNNFQILEVLLLSKTRKGNVFDDILEQNKAFLD